MQISLRERLLSKVNFNEFPPSSGDINGWPLQLWEVQLPTLTLNVPCIHFITAATMLELLAV